MALDAGKVVATLSMDLDDRGFREGEVKKNEWARKDATAQLKFDLDDRDFRRAEERLAVFGRQDATATLRFDVDRNSLQRLVAAAGSGGGAVRNTETAFEGAAESAFNFGNVIGAIKWPALIGGAVEGAQALTALAAGGSSVIASLSSLAGLAVTVPQGLLGFAQVLGTVKLATAGVGDALNAYTEQQAQSGVTAQRAAQQDQTAAAARKNAAYTVVQAQQGVATANRQVQYAQESLTQAQFEATRQMEDLRRAATNTALSEKQASLSLREAQRELAKAERDPTTSGLDLRQLQLGVEQARQSLRDAQIGADRSRQDLERAQRQGGAQGLPQVVAARRALADAERQLSDSQRQLAHDQEAARQQVQQAAAAQQTAADSANVYKRALDQLPPAVQQFVRFLIPLKARLDDLRETAAEGFLPGVEQGITAALKNFPVLNRVIGQTGNVLGNIASKVGHYLGRAGVGRDFERFAGTNLKLLRDFARQGFNYADSLRIILRDAQPFLRWLGRFGTELSRQFEGWIRYLHRSGQLGDFFTQTARALRIVVSLLSHTGGTLLNVFKAIAPVGNELLRFFDKLAKSAEDFTGSLKGQLAIGLVFERLRHPVQILVKLFGELVGLLFSALTSEEGVKGLKAITQALREAEPSLAKVAELLVELVSILGPPAVEALAAFLGVIADGAGPLRVMVEWMAKIIDALVWVIDNVPGLSQATGVIAAFGITLGGIKWAYAATGLKDLAGGLYSVFKKGGVIERAPQMVSQFMDQIVGFPGALRNRAARIVGSVKEVFVRIGSRLGLITGEEAAVGTVGGEQAGGLIGRVKGLAGRIRSALGRTFSSIGSWLGLTAGEKAAEGIAGGEAGGAQAGGLIGSFRGKYLPRLKTFFRERVGKGIGLAIVAGMVLALPLLIPKAFHFGEQIGAAIRKPIRTVFEGLVNFIIDRLNDIIGAVNAVPLAPDMDKIGHVDFTSGNDTHSSGSPAQNRAARRHAALEQRQMDYFNAHPNARVLPPRLRQHGGPVVPGQDYIVGEAGPELFSPDTSGTIVSNKRLRGVGGPLSPTIEKSTKALAKLIRKDVIAEYAGLGKDVGDRHKELEDDTTRSFDAIHDTAKQKSENAHTDVADEWDALSKHHDTVTGQMRDRTRDRFGAMADISRDRSRDLDRYVSDAMGSAADVTYAGMSFIGDAVEKATKAFDSKDKFNLSLKKPDVQHHAQGGMIGGTGRQDTVPLLLGMAAPGEAILTRYQQGWVDTALKNTFGFGLPNLFDVETRSHAFERGGVIPGFDKGGQTGSYVFPLTGNFTWGRTDMGVDFGGTATIRAIGDAIVTAAGGLAGWPGGQGVDYRLQGGVPGGFSPSSNTIYNYEHIRPRVHAGQHVRAGDPIADLLAGFPGLETGWGSGTFGNTLAAGHYSEGDVTAEGSSFKKFLQALQKGDVRGAERIGRLLVQGTDGPTRAIVQAALDLTRTEANRYMGTLAPSPGAPVGPHAARGINSAREFIPFWDEINPDLKRYANTFAYIVPAESGWNPRASNGTHFGWYQFDAPTWAGFKPKGAPPAPMGPYDPTLATQAAGNVIRREGAGGFGRWETFHGIAHQRGGYIGGRRFATGGILDIGDSHTWLSGGSSAYPGWDVDAYPGRDSTIGLDVLGNLLRPDHKTVVFDLATNDWRHPSRFAKNLHGVSDLIGDRGLVLVNSLLQSTGPSAGSLSGGVNQVLQGFASRGRRRKLVDWASVAAGHPEWGLDDYIHFNSDAYAKRVQMVKHAASAFARGGLLGPVGPLLNPDLSENIDAAGQRADEIAGGIGGGSLDHMRHRLRGLTNTAQIQNVERVLKGIAHRERTLGRHDHHAGLTAHQTEMERRMRKHAAQLHHRITRLKQEAKDHAHKIAHVTGRIGQRLYSGFERADVAAELGGGSDFPAALANLRIGKHLGSPQLRKYATERRAQVANRLAISRAQSPILASGPFFGGGGIIGGAHGSQYVRVEPQITLVLDSDAAAYTKRISSVVDGRHEELARSAGMARLAGNARTRRAVYQTGRRS